MKINKEFRKVAGKGVHPNAQAVCVNVSLQDLTLVSQELRARLPDRPAITFVRADNAASLRAHRKMWMR